MASDCSVIFLSVELNQIERLNMVGDNEFLFVFGLRRLTTLFLLLLLLLFLLLLPLVCGFVALDVDALPLELAGMKILRKDTMVTLTLHDGHVPAC